MDKYLVTASLLFALATAAMLFAVAELAAIDVPPPAPWMDGTADDPVPDQPANRP